MAPSRSALRLLLAGGAATARARGARALEELVEAAVVAMEAEEGVGVGVVAGVGVSVAAVEVEAEAAVAVRVEAAEAAAAEVELVEAELCSGDPSTSHALVRPRRPCSFVSGMQGARGLGGDLLKSGVAIFDLDFDAILAAMYVVSVSAEGDCYVCVPPNPGIEAAALGASESAALGADRTTLTPLSRPVAVSLADPSGGPVLAHHFTVLPCPAAPSGSLSGLYLPSFSTNLGSGPDSAPCSCRLLSHQTLLWHHRLGHPSLPRLRGMSSHVLVSGLPRSLPPLPPRPAPTCVPYVEGRQRADPHSSKVPPTEAPLQTLHMDVWGPARVRGQGHERYFLLVVDDFSRYTSVFPLRRK
ncbi:unnamed protein product, partial [Closterium sp. NIES-53]